jgi:hypothetical protein
MSDVPIIPFSCPGCGTQLDMAANAFDDTPIGEGPGMQFSMCLRCGEFMVIEKTARGLVSREATVQELAEIQDDPHVIKMRRTFRVLSRQRRYDKE